jgi:cation diffusion facilitator CzcD-associated flavoprotein CzcO
MSHGYAKWRNALQEGAVWFVSRKFPKLMRSLLRRGAMTNLPVGYPVDVHFKPRYNPWDQRVCLDADGDLFEAISSGRVDVVTDHIDHIDATGIALKSGQHLDADIIVTATGIELLFIGGIDLSVDGEPLEVSEKLTYKGMMLEGVPNLAIAIGYTNASWTLKCDLTCEYVCRLLNHMDERGHRQVVPGARDASFPTQPFIDLKSGYVQRSIDQFPRQGLKAPWRLYQNYARDIIMLRYGAIDDGALEFSSPAATAERPASLAA